MIQDRKSMKAFVSSFFMKNLTEDQQPIADPPMEMKYCNRPEHSVRKKTLRHATCTKCDEKEKTLKREGRSFIGVLKKLSQSDNGTLDQAPFETTKEISFRVKQAFLEGYNSICDLVTPNQEDYEISYRDKGYDEPAGSFSWRPNMGRIILKDGQPLVPPTIDFLSYLTTEQNEKLDENAILAAAAQEPTLEKFWQNNPIMRSLMEHVTFLHHASLKNASCSQAGYGHLMYDIGLNGRAENMHSDIDAERHYARAISSCELLDKLDAVAAKILNHVHAAAMLTARSTCGCHVFRAHSQQALYPWSVSRRHEDVTRVSVDICANEVMVNDYLQEVIKTDDDRYLYVVDNEPACRAPRDNHGNVRIGYETYYSERGYKITIRRYVWPMLFAMVFIALFVMIQGMRKVSYMTFDGVDPTSLTSLVIVIEGLFLAFITATFREEWSWYDMIRGQAYTNELSALSDARKTNSSLFGMILQQSVYDTGEFSRVHEATSCMFSKGHPRGVLVPVIGNDISLARCGILLLKNEEGDIVPYSYGDIRLRKGHLENRHGLIYHFVSDPNAHTRGVTMLDTVASISGSVGKVGSLGWRRHRAIH